MFPCDLLDLWPWLAWAIAVPFMVLENPVGVFDLSPEAGFPRIVAAFAVDGGARGPLLGWDGADGVFDRGGWGFAEDTSISSR